MTLAQAIWKLAAGLFFRYQKRWAQVWNQADYLAILGGRQIGKDWFLEFMLAFQLATRRNVDWIVISATRMHAKTFLRGVRRWFSVFRRLAATIGAPFPTLEVDSAFELVSSWETTVAVSSGTVRSLTGKRGGVILNEFPLIPEADLLFPSAVAQVDMALSLGKPVKLIVVGNASFIGTPWHELWTGLQRTPGDWHMITQRWSEAMVDRGLTAQQLEKATKAKLANLNGNEAAFRQWYECDFRAAEGALFSPELLAHQSYDELPHIKNPRQYIGYDVGRINDPSAWSQLLLDGAVGYALDTVFAEGMPFPDQRRLTQELVSQYPTGNLTLDGTGLGGGQTDDLRVELARTTKVNEYKIGADKWQLLGQLKGAFEDGKVFIPRSDKDLRMQLESVQSEMRDNDGLKIILPRLGNSHGDGAIALALAVEGARHRLAVRPPATIQQVLSGGGIASSFTGL